MKSKTLATAILLAGLSAFTQSSFAEGMYLAGSLGSSIPTTASKSDIDIALVSACATNLSTSMANGTAMKFLAGYEFNPNIAIEGGYFDSGTITYGGTATGATISADVKATGLQVAILGIAPINDKFSLFGKVGYTAVSVKSNARVNTTTVSSTSDKNNSGYGFGATYKLSDKLSLRGEWESVASDVNAITLGLQLKF